MSGFHIGIISHVEKTREEWQFIANRLFEYTYKDTVFAYILMCVLSWRMQIFLAFFLFENKCTVLIERFCLETLAQRLYYFNVEQNQRKHISRCSN